MGWAKEPPEMRLEGCSNPVWDGPVRDLGVGCREIAGWDAAFRFRAEQKQLAEVDCDACFLADRPKTRAT